MRGTTGSSRIALTVDAGGRVTAVEVLDSEPAGVFEQAARRLGRALSFRPALREGRPVAARVTLRLVWRLES
jgi:protein TonB